MTTTPRPKAVVVCSGGMDSTTLVADYTRHYDVTVVSFDYGQRHARELHSAANVATHYGLEHIIVNLFHYGKLLSGSALTDSTVAVPEGHYTAETMVATIVPNRNAIMANLAAGIAIARGAEVTALGVHAGDHAVYPDCRPEFINALNTMLEVATEGLPTTHIEAPYVRITKANIATLGGKFGAPLHLSWSCYQGGDLHCGRCGTCVERAEAFHLAGLTDPTEYADPTFWQTAVAGASS